MEQATSHILMIRPTSFGFNAETAQNNTFQNIPSGDSVRITANTIMEFDSFVHQLRQEGVNVTVIEDPQEPRKPDAVFPNNWISFHDDGTVVTYPMYSSLRRLERRLEIIDLLRHKFSIHNEFHLEDYESQEIFLEGTGSMVLDRVHKIAYASSSDRTDIGLVDLWCEKMGYAAFTFSAISNGIPIYHTNVMMAIATTIAVICFECIPDQERRNALKENLSKTHSVILITLDQMESFAGNMLALKNNQGEELMVMSSRASMSLNSEQRREIEKSCRIVACPINTIEDIGGGSARCMIAEIFLQPK